MVSYYMVPQGARRMRTYRPVEFNGGRRLPVDVRLEDETYEITAAVPGLKVEDIKLEILDDVLTLSGEIEAPEEAEYLLREVQSGSFSRQIRFPYPVDASGAEAHVENGMLTVRLPKAEQARPKVIQIKAD